MDTNQTTNKNKNFLFTLQQKIFNPYILTGFIFFTFFIIVGVNYFYFRNIERSHLSKHAQNKLLEMQKNIERDLNEPIILLLAAAEYMRTIISPNDTKEDVTLLLRNISNIIVENKHYKFNSYGLFGYYERFGGAFVDSEVWTPDDDYNPKERAWYKGAIKANGEIAVSDFFYDASSKDLVISYSVLVFDENNDPLIVLSLNVPIIKIAENIIDKRISEGGYGVMLDQNFNIIAHPDSNYLGVPLSKVINGTTLQKKVMEKGSVSEYKMIDHQQNDAVVFSKMLSNGWHIGVLTPVNEYYERIRSMTSFTFALSIVLAAILSLILHEISASKRKSDAYAKVMFDSVPVACCLWDRTYHITTCNQETLDLYGLKDKEEYQRRYFELSPKHQPGGGTSVDMILDILEDVFENGTPQRFEWVHVNLKGELLPCEIIAKRIKYGKEFFIAMYKYDLRKLKEAEQQNREEKQKVEMALASNMAKSKFLATMSHEIRTPMNAILGITEILLQNKNLSSNIKEPISRIYNSADLLLGIINDILDLSKIDAGKMEIVPEEYQVASLIYDTVNLNTMRNDNKPIKFELSVDENIPSALIGDELRIKQILNNLLSNSFKFTAEGKISLSFHVKKKDDEKILLSLCVSDTGSGMTKKQLEKLFMEYTRFDNNLMEGTGLGMNITQNLVNMMDGNISVSSELNRGTAFTVNLPQKIANPKILGKELAQNLQNFRFDEFARKKAMPIDYEYMPYGNVLVVDDMETNLYVAKGLMQPYGLKLDTADSGFQALEKIEAGNTYDIIFMDHMMPKMDGMATTKKIRELNYTAPIIALTANAVVNQSKIFLSNGFDEFISKPIDVRQLNAVLTKYIRDKQPPEVLEAARKEAIKDIKDITQINEKWLPTFLKDAKKFTSTLESILENINSASDDDLELFSVNAHAMKSILLNINEKELSEKAFLLEQAGKNRNKNLITEKTQELTSAVKTIVAKIETIVQKETFNTMNENTEFLRKQLKIIDDACEKYDERTASAAINTLLKDSWKQETKINLDKISEHLLHSDFEEAAVIAKNLLENTIG